MVADIGCGPGHVARYLNDQGVTIFGVDLSPAMIRCAARLNPRLDFRVGDMRTLELPASSLAGIVAFYSIVHFEPGDLRVIMREMRRVLASDGLALVSFHVGNELVHVDELFGAPVNLDFRFHDPADVVAALRAAPFSVIEQVERRAIRKCRVPKSAMLSSRKGDLIPEQWPRGACGVGRRSREKFCDRSAGAPRSTRERALEKRPGDLPSHPHSGSHTRVRGDRCDLAGSSRRSNQTGECRRQAMGGRRFSEVHLSQLAADVALLHYRVKARWEHQADGCSIGEQCLCASEGYMETCIPSADRSCEFGNEMICII